MIHSRFLAAVLGVWTGIGAPLSHAQADIKSVNGKSVTLDCKAISDSALPECTLRLDTLVHANELTSASVLAISVFSDSARVLVEACGPSRPPNFHRTGYCAAGEECDLLWLELDRQGKLRRSKGYLVDSCLESIVPEGDLCQHEANLVRCTYIDYHTNEAASVTFDLSKSAFSPQILSHHIEP